MRPPHDVPQEWLHPPSLDRAREVQAELARRVIAADDPGDALGGTGPRRVAGVDVSNSPYDPDAMVHAAVAVLDGAGLGVVRTAGARRRADFPYVPGFLGFREVPALLDAFRELAEPPDLVVVDGHGLSHPRGLGIACHLGVLLDLPAIGVAKSVLVGKPEGELGEEAGSRVPLVWRGRVVGAVLRTKRRVNPVYVSVGHRVSLEGAVRRVLALTRGYRLPEPTRQAHLAANAFRRAAGERPEAAPE